MAPEAPESRRTDAAIEDHELFQRVLLDDPQAQHAWAQRLARVSQLAFWRYGTYDWFDHDLRDEWTQLFRIHLWQNDWRNLRAWRRQGSLDAYLYRVAENLAKTLYKRESRHRGRFISDADTRETAVEAEGESVGAVRSSARSIEERPDEGPQPDAIVSARHQLARRRMQIKEFLGELRAPDREALLLHFQEQLASDAAARRLGIQAPAFRKRVERATVRATALLRNQFPDLGDDLEGVFA